MLLTKRIAASGDKNGNRAYQRQETKKKNILGRPDGFTFTTVTLKTLFAGVFLEVFI